MVYHVGVPPANAGAKGHSAVYSTALMVLAGEILTTNRT